MELNFVRASEACHCHCARMQAGRRKRLGEKTMVVRAVRAGRRRVGKQCCCGMSVCNSLSQTSRVRAACPISYRQNALKMPQVSRAVIIEETRADGRRGREAKLRRGKLRARPWIKGWGRRRSAATCVRGDTAMLLVNYCERIPAALLHCSARRSTFEIVWKIFGIRECKSYLNCHVLFNLRSLSCNIVQKD